MNNNNKGGNFRSTIPPFTMVDNRVIENKKLSMKAKGLYLIIMHYVTIPNFTLNKRYLMSLSKEGERAFDSTWKELKEAGYLKQYRLKGEGGKWVYEYELLIEPVIENDTKEIQNKKPSTSAKVESYNKNIKKNSFDNNSIAQSSEKNTKKNELEEITNSDILKVINESCVNVKKQDLKDCQNEFLDIDKLRDALKICEVNNNHGIKALRMAYKYGDVKGKSKSNSENYKPNRFHNCRNRVLDYTKEELEDILKANEKRKEVKRKQEELKGNKYNQNINIKEYVKNSIMDNEYFEALENEYKIMVIDYIDINKVFKPNWIKI